MKPSAAVLAAFLLAPGLAGASTVPATLNFTATDQSLFGGGGTAAFGAEDTLDLSIAELSFGAEASAGDIDATASARIDATHPDVVHLSAAGAVPVSLALNGLTLGFDTLLGAAASASLDFGPIFDLIDPAPITLVDQDYSLQTEATASGGLGTTATDTGEVALAGVGVPEIPLVTLQADLSLNASQTSSLLIEDLMGIVRARHQSGVTRIDAFSMATDTLSVFNLGIVGLWDLDLIGVLPKSVFSSTFGLSATASVGAALGYDCGDFDTDEDNGFFCLGDIGTSATSPQLSLYSGSPFALAFTADSADIGDVLVYVPVPASMLLLLGGLGSLLGAARRKPSARTI